jgi:RNA polymerase-associated protein RTF1
MRQKIEQLAKLPTTPLTEACTIFCFGVVSRFQLRPSFPQADITAMIARKNALNPKNIAISQAFAARAQLTQQRNLALKRQDYKEAAQIDQELETLASVQEAAGKRERAQDSHADLMARVNERNRKANLEAVRQAEAAQVARKRQERKAAAAGAAIGQPVMFDVSARVKTVPRIHHSRLVTFCVICLFAGVKPIISGVVAAELGLRTGRRR